ncbi:PE-PPE domain-containing protein [Mycobacterium sp. 1164985.4]|uniref:PE-PPE domain-containing protein n=1 Tax=Mycobacterium sp. 1164985.4 TaxID=1834069 RepID=UPI00080162F6|nr:PE-PPE domain-containing protein [Mycobacterium sp. 1164985.4]OBK75380.1 hypothetical protein A5650_18015 [Mycobacterium sp. 1164985.4]
MVLALLGAVALVVAWTTATAVQLAASALIMGGTDHPLSTPPDDPFYVNQYLNNAVKGFINPASQAPTGTDGEPIDSVGGGDSVYAVIYPAEFFPVFGSKTFDASVAEGVGNLERCARGSLSCRYNPYQPILKPPVGPPSATDDLVIFGYSQSAVVASLVKRNLIANPRPGETSFFLLANPMRPNGGILARGPDGLTIPILGVTFYGATPTDSCKGDGPCMPTVDAAAQYDGLGGDAPASLTNVLAIVNSLAGYYYLHGDLQNADFDDAKYQGSYGDTDYYLYPTKRLPILMPFEALVPSPILTALDAPLRVLIEGAYARDVNPGIATKVGLLPFRNPIKTAIDLVKSIPTGIDDAVQEVSGKRPLGTEPTTSPFGVGGPDLPPPPTQPESIGARSMMWSRAGDMNQDGQTVIEADGSSIGEDGLLDDPLKQDPLKIEPNEVTANPVPLGADGEAANLGEKGQAVVSGEEGQATNPGDVVPINERADGQPAENAGTGVLTLKPPKVSVKPALPKLPKLRGPIKFDSPVRLGPSPGVRPNRSGTGDSPTESQPGSTDDNPAGANPGANPGGGAGAEGAAA